VRLLFITQKLHGQDAFAVQWVNAFRAIGYDVTVLCLEWRPEDIKTVLGQDADLSFTVHSLGKEKGVGKIKQILTFWKLITTLKYDRVFIHMTPVWGLVGALVWVLRRTPVYLWYTHYKMQIGLWLIGLYGKRMFCATPQSLPQYQGSSKKVVVGHGIDLAFWPKRPNHTNDGTKLLIVHRLSRSKRVEITLRAMTLLPEYILDIYGIPAEQDYVTELQALVRELHLEDRVRFKGSAPLNTLAEIYTHHRLIINMASETIDKTMLEAMTCGCYPVTTKGNAAAIGIDHAPAEDTPEALAAFIRQYSEKAPLSADAMYEVVEKKHSLKALIEKMDAYIAAGN
jgi:glycosyltransferase involved in cell wall biosynthesis